MATEAQQVIDDHDEAQRLDAWYSQKSIGHARACADFHFEIAHQCHEELDRLGLWVLGPDENGVRTWQGGSSRERSIARVAFELAQYIAIQKAALHEVEGLTARLDSLDTANATKRQTVEARRREVLGTHAELAGGRDYQVKRLVADLRRRFGEKACGKSTVDKIVGDLNCRLSATADEIEASGGIEPEALVDQVLTRHETQVGVNRDTVKYALRGRARKARRAKLRGQPNELSGKTRS